MAKLPQTPEKEALKGKAKKKKAIKVRGARKIRIKALPIYTRQLAAMLGSGMPLVQCMMALEEQSEDPNFRPVVAALRMRVEGGSMYSDALRSFPSVFDDLYVNMMRAGEMGGILADTAARVATFLESSNRLRRKVKSAMMYPTVVIIAAIILASALIVFVLPTFVGMFADFGAQLPGPTQALLNISNAVRNNALLTIGIVVAIAFAFNRFKKTEKGAYMVDEMKLRFPLLGRLAQGLAISRFAATFAQLMHSGVPILSALDIVSMATGNKVIGKVLIEAKDNVERGEPLSSALEKNKYYPRMLVHMLAAGERTGQVEEMLQKTAEFYEDEVETMVSGLTSMIEPLLMVFVGLLIGSIVICMFLPVFKMSEIINM
jgi:type IV pilus assembly protein PilC